MSNIPFAFHLVVVVDHVIDDDFEAAAAPVTQTTVANPDMVSVLREARGRTQQRLADEAGVSQGYVSKVESRLMDMTGARLEAVAKALDAPVELLAATSLPPASRCRACSTGAGRAR